MEKVLEKDQIYEATIIDRENEGRGIAKINGMVVFISNALLGEEGKILITDVKNHFAIGEMIEVTKPSINRNIPLCPHYKDCGGCQLWHESFESELEFKKEKVNKLFKHHFPNLEMNIENIVHKERLGYRNKVIFKIEKDIIGFYQNDTNTLVNIEKCYLLDDISNNILSIVADFIKRNDHKLSELMIRTNGIQVMIHLVGGEPKLSEKLHLKLINSNLIASFYYNDHLVTGQPFLKYKLNNIDFQVGLKSFLQINQFLTEDIYQTIIDITKENKINTILDLYSGIGSISLVLANFVKNVIGIEIIKEAVDDAKQNAFINNIFNVEFYAGDVLKIIDEININPELIIVDPPRRGLEKEVINKIINLSSKHLIYVSCDPNTLVRDLLILKENYKIEKIQIFNQFPLTHHVETLVYLKSMKVGD